MEQYYSNDSLTAFKTDEGILIEEKKKGSIKMLLLILGIGLLVLVGGFLMGMLGGTIGLAMAPFLIWGAALVLAVGIIAFIVKMAVPSDPKITFDTTKQEVYVRGKIIAFSEIEQIMNQEQPMMGKTMMFAFMKINGKKKTLFSTGIVPADPQAMKDFISELNDLVQKGKLTGSLQDKLNKN